MKEGRIFEYTIEHIPVFKHLFEILSVVLHELEIVHIKPDKPIDAEKADSDSDSNSESQSSSNSDSESESEKTSSTKKQIVKKKVEVEKGGLKIVETAADLAVACSLISSAKDIALPSTLVAIGELGLSREVRMVSGLETRIREAEKLGFKTALIPAANQKQKNFPTLKNSLSKIELIAIGHIRDLARFFQKN